jgi:chromate transporter
MIMDWLTFFMLFLKASLLSTGGRGPFPYLYTDLVSRGWAVESNFAEALTVGEISPGPSGLWVVSLGYLTGGMVGAVLAALAILMPPLFVLVVARIHERLKSFRATQGVLDGLVLAIIGSGVVVLTRLFVSNGVNVITLGIALITVALTLTNRVPTWALLALAGLTGMVLLR